MLTVLFTAVIANISIYKFNIINEMLKMTVSLIKYPV